MSLQQFKLSDAGQKIAEVLLSEEAVRRMELKSEAERPAVEAIGRDIQSSVGTLDNDSKKLVGRWVREVLEARGWRPARKGRVARGHFFSRGTVYRRAAPELPRGDGAARLKAAQELVRKLPYPLPSVDEFLTERRKMWGE